MHAMRTTFTGSMTREPSVGEPRGRRAARRLLYRIAVELVATDSRRMARLMIWKDGESP